MAPAVPETAAEAAAAAEVYPSQAPNDGATEDTLFAAANLRHRWFVGSLVGSLFIRRFAGSFIGALFHSLVRWFVR